MIPLSVSHDSAIAPAIAVASRIPQCFLDAQRAAWDQYHLLHRQLLDAAYERWEREHQDRIVASFAEYERATSPVQRAFALDTMIHLLHISEWVTAWYARARFPVRDHQPIPLRSSP